MGVLDSWCPASCGRSSWTDRQHHQYLYSLQVGIKIISDKLWRLYNDLSDIIRLPTLGKIGRHLAQSQRIIVWQNVKCLSTESRTNHQKWIILFQDDKLIHIYTYLFIFYTLGLKWGARSTVYSLDWQHLIWFWLPHPFWCLPFPAFTPTVFSMGNYGICYTDLKVISFSHEWHVREESFLSYYYEQIFPFITPIVFPVSRSFSVQHLYVSALLSGGPDLPDRLRVPHRVRDHGALPGGVSSPQGDHHPKQTQWDNWGVFQAKYLCTYGRAKLYVAVTALFSIGKTYFNS